MEDTDLPGLYTLEANTEPARGSASEGKEGVALAATETRNGNGKTEEDEKTRDFVEALSGVTDGVTGMLRVRGRKRRRDGTEEQKHWPFPHQRKCAKRLIAKNNPRMLVCHDAGMGKTFTFLLAVAGLHTLGNGQRPRVLVTAPASCLVQWKAAVLDCLRISERRVLVCNSLALLTRETMRNHDIFILSRDTVGRAFSALYEWRLSEDGLRRAWMRREGVASSPIFDEVFDILGVDEAHAMRNTQTACTQGHSLIAKKSARVVALTASPVFNSPTDLAGISLACDFPEQFTRVQNWFVDAKRTRVDVQTISAFQAHVDRACESVLNLPPLICKTVLFDVRFAVPEEAQRYNAVLLGAKRLLRAHSRRGQLKKDEAVRLEASVQRLQQMAVSPLLEEVGAVALQADPVLVERASVDHTGSLAALERELACFLSNRDFPRVMVCSCHTSILSLANHYCASRGRLGAEQFVFTGRLSLRQRGDMLDAFLSSPKAILFLSIDAGGTGLHICPGCNAVIFWGSRPFTPMKLVQAQKRVHRIGQNLPVHVVHLVGNHSVDFAIDGMHQGKRDVARAVADNNLTALPRDGSWKMVGRIVDRCGLADAHGRIRPESLPVPSLRVAAQQQQQTRQAAQPPPRAVATPQQRQQQVQLCFGHSRPLYTIGVPFLQGPPAASAALARLPPPMQPPSTFPPQGIQPQPLPPWAITNLPNLQPFLAPSAPITKILSNRSSLISR